MFWGFMGSARALPSQTLTHMYPSRHLFHQVHDLLAHDLEQADEHLAKASLVGETDDVKLSKVRR